MQLDPQTMIALLGSTAEAGRFVGSDSLRDAFVHYQWPQLVERLEVGSVVRSHLRILATMTDAPDTATRNVAVAALAFAQTHEAAEWLLDLLPTRPDGPDRDWIHKALSHMGSWSRDAVRQRLLHGDCRQAQSAMLAALNCPELIEWPLTPEARLSRVSFAQQMRHSVRQLPVGQLLAGLVFVSASEVLFTAGSSWSWIRVLTAFLVWIVFLDMPSLERALPCLIVHLFMIGIMGSH